MGFARAWLTARSRVLTRNAEAAEHCAARTRQRTALFPDAAAELEQVAAGLDRYAAACRAAAEDPSLPSPEYAWDRGRAGPGSGGLSRSARQGDAV